MSNAPAVRGTTTAEKPAADDAGFSVVEVVVAMTVFVVLAVAVLAVLLTALGGTRSNAQRVQAANLAAEQVEAVRSLRADQIPDGVTNPPSSGTVVDGTTYTVTQSASFLTGDGAASICTSTSTKPTFKRVSVSVTWPDMGAVAPVTSDTVVSVGLGRAGLDETKGIAAILVRDAKAAPVASQLVTLGTSSSRLTDKDGCAVFVNLAPGSYSAVLDTDTWVDLDGVQRHVEPITVVAAEVRRVEVDYDLAGSLSASFTAPSGYSIPTAVNIPLTIKPPGDSGVPRRALDCAAPGADPRTCASSLATGARVVENLFPRKYNVWAGACLDAEPITLPNLPSVEVGQGLSSSVSLPLAEVRIQVQGSVTANQRVYARHAADGGCSETFWDIGGAPRNGNERLNVALPQGTYTFSLDPTGGSKKSDMKKLTVGIVQDVSVKR